MQLKTLTAKTLGQKSEFDKDMLEKTLPQECIELVNLYHPLTKNNVWQVLSKLRESADAQREKECEKFLVDKNKIQPSFLESLRIIKLYFWDNQEINSFFTQDFFSKRLQRDCRKHSISSSTLSTSIDSIATTCSQDVKRIEKEYLYTTVSDNPIEIATNHCGRAVQCCYISCYSFCLLSAFMYFLM